MIDTGPTAGLLALSPPERSEQIARAFRLAISAMGAVEPDAIRKKFRKMARDPASFYRGSATLFYADLDGLPAPWLDERTSRVWIQGDLHVENFGSYMNSAGVLVFDVNDFDEAYVGPFTWDLQRMSASLALLGFAKAFSDETIAAMIRVYTEAYVAQVEEFAAAGTHDLAITLATADGPLRATLLAARARTRIGLLDAATVVEGGERRFAEGPEVRRLGGVEREAALAAFADYLSTIPSSKREHSLSYRVKDVVGRSGFGIGSAGLRAYNVLVEGRTEALENDVILSIKQGNVAAPSRAIDDPRIRSFFVHDGHRTAVSQLSLQNHADPWLGYTVLNGVGQIVRELSPYEADLDWSDLAEPDDVLGVLPSLGRVTARAHCVSDASSDQTLVPFHVEEAVARVIGADREGFVRWLTEFGTGYAKAVRRDHHLFVDLFRSGQDLGL